MLVESAVGTKVVSGTVTIGTSTVRISSSSKMSKSGFWLRADQGNSGIIRIGDGNTSSMIGYPLAAGDVIPVAIEDLTNLYANGSASGQILHYIGVD